MISTPNFTAPTITEPTLNSLKTLLKAVQDQGFCTEDSRWNRIVAVRAVYGNGPLPTGVTYAQAVTDTARALPTKNATTRETYARRIATTLPLLDAALYAPSLTSTVIDTLFWTGKDRTGRISIPAHQRATDLTSQINAPCAKTRARTSRTIYAVPTATVTRNGVRTVPAPSNRKVYAATA